MEYDVELFHADADPQLSPVGFEPVAEVVVDEDGGLIVVLVEAGELLLDSELLIDEIEREAPETGQESALAVVINSEPASGYWQSCK